MIMDDVNEKQGNDFLIVKIKTGNSYNGGFFPKFLNLCKLSLNLMLPHKFNLLWRKDHYEEHISLYYPM